MSQLHNVYFVLMAQSKSEAHAVAEAERLAKQFGGPMGVDVRRCGTQARIASVLPSGIVSVTETPAIEEMEKGKL